MCNKITLKAIASVDERWGIGLGNELIVHNSPDLRHFARLTRGRPVIMGRRTFESLPDGQPLPDRQNFVLSRNPNFHPVGAIVVRDINELFCSLPDGLSWVIGGGEVYSQLIDYCVAAEITINHVCDKLADTYFPNLDSPSTWLRSRVVEAYCTPDGIDYDYVKYINLDVRPIPINAFRERGCCYESGR